MSEIVVKAVTSSTPDVDGVDSVRTACSKDVGLLDNLMLLVPTQDLQQHIQRARQAIEEELSVTKCEDEHLDQLEHLSEHFNKLELLMYPLMDMAVAMSLLMPPCFTRKTFIDIPLGDEDRRFARNLTCVKFNRLGKDGIVFGPTSKYAQEYLNSFPEGLECFRHGEIWDYIHEKYPVWQESCTEQFKWHCNQIGEEIRRLQSRRKRPIKQLFTLVQTSWVAADQFFKSTTGSGSILNAVNGSGAQLVSTSNPSSPDDEREELINDESDDYFESTQRAHNIHALHQRTIVLELAPGHSNNDREVDADEKDSATALDQGGGILKIKPRPEDATALANDSDYDFNRLDCLLEKNEALRASAEAALSGTPENHGDVGVVQYNEELDMQSICKDLPPLREFAPLTEALSGAVALVLGTMADHDLEDLEEDEIDDVLAQINSYLPERAFDIKVTTQYTFDGTEDDVISGLGFNNITVLPQGVDVEHDNADVSSLDLNKSEHVIDEQKNRDTGILSLDLSKGTEVDTPESDKDSLGISLIELIETKAVPHDEHDDWESVHSQDDNGEDQLESPEQRDKYLPPSQDIEEIKDDWESETLIGSSPAQPVEPEDQEETFIEEASPIRFLELASGTKSGTKSKLTTIWESNLNGIPQTLTDLELDTMAHWRIDHNWRECSCGKLIDDKDD